MTRRLFVAAWLPRACADEAAAVLAALRVRDDSVRWVGPENLHVTLAFLGDVAEDRLADVEDRIARGLHGAEGFSLRLAGLGAFPARGDVRVAWIGVEEGAKEIAALASRVERTLAAGRYVASSDRPFHAHVTLGRPKGSRGFGRLREILGSMTFRGNARRVEEITLAESRLTPRGAEYHATCRFALTGAAVQVRHLVQGESS